MWNTIGKSELALESFTTTDVDSGSANSKAFPDTFTCSICPDEPNEEGVSDKPVIGISIFSEPLNETPAILLAVCNIVAVAAFPVQEPDEPLALPVKFPINPVAVIFPVEGL